MSPRQAKEEEATTQEENTQEENTCILFGQYSEGDPACAEECVKAEECKAKTAENDSAFGQPAEDNGLVEEDPNAGEATQEPGGEEDGLGDDSLASQEEGTEPPPPDKTESVGTPAPAKKKGRKAGTKNKKKEEDPPEDPGTPDPNVVVPPTEPLEEPPALFTAEQIAQKQAEAAALAGAQHTVNHININITINKDLAEAIKALAEAM